MNPKVLRQHARDCGRLAEECADVFTRQALRELAVEFQRTAGSIEATMGRKRIWKARSRQRRLPSRNSRKPPHRLSNPRRRASR